MRTERFSPFFALACCVLAGAAALAPSWAASHAHGKSSKTKSPRAATPQSIGQFGDWQAATHNEAGQTICYAFTRPLASAPALPGRGDVVLTVTERAKLRDTVALSAGFSYPANTEVAVNVDDTKFSFYTSERSAFAHDGTAMIAAFNKGNDATVVSPAPKGRTVTDHFSLKGFSAAMKTVLAACPAK